MAVKKHHTQNDELNWIGEGDSKRMEFQNDEEMEKCGLKASFFTLLSSIPQNKQVVLVSISDLFKLKVGSTWHVSYVQVIVLFFISFHSWFDLILLYKGLHPET